MSSKAPDIGFNFKTICATRLSEIFTGYNTGVRNNKPCTKKGITYLTSRYFIFKAAKKVPHPIAEKQVINTLNGNNKSET